MDMVEQRQRMFLWTGDGKYALELYEEGKFNELIEYCSNDVRLTEKIYLKYLELRNATKT